ncbi:beta-(1,2)-xylosyltransferase-like [Cynara cardunculus var. scolymus]|uniref:Glycosyltransferase AER61, uncharacterized n=1 Tax=Cynara cardunculus var. scolymus TaxID=59895 RepID=A0A103XYI8_CYNCS|nr:beta-(1,2)-xylosyltransferase-like [Cynara cardunculus var. scolymus]KVH99194.1 Glycosyltransferase AER61, uncharacterized [Cynara cardunculus var. scolymus]
MKTKTLYILVSLFVLNSITLYHYLSSNFDYFHHRLRSHSLPENVNISLTVYHNSPFHDRANDVPLYNFVNKPWPISPSYLPWPLSPNNITYRSCEAYFGNGFSRRVDLLKPKLRGGGGWFRCFYSSTLESSVCEGGRIRMHPEKVKMSVGGEELESVIGRKEDDELPKFEFGAFDLEVDEKLNSRKKLVDGSFLDQYLKKGSVPRHTVRELIDSMQLVGANEFKCSEWIEEPTLLVTRFEYANLFHTVTDWYSAYVSSRVTGLPIRPRLVFIDGHCLTPLDDTWKAMFSSLRYAKHFSGPVCFRHAILPPLGYETVLSRGLFEDLDCRGGSAHEVLQNPNEPITARISEFGDMIKAAFGLPLNKPHPTSNHHNILFIRREGYLAHPRHGGTVQPRLENEQEVFDGLKKWASSHSKCKVNVINGILAHMPMKEQLRAIEEASIIMGAHGAGLTHIVSATQEAEIVELIGVEFMRPHYALISKWKGIKYHPMHLREAYAVPSEVIDKVSNILANLGC